MARAGDAPRAELKKVLAELTAELAKPVPDRGYDKLYELWQALLRFERARTKGKRCCVVCRVEIGAPEARHAADCTVGAALEQVEHTVSEQLTGRRVRSRLRSTPAKFRPELVASFLDLDARQQTELVETVDGWESRADVALMYVAIAWILDLIEIGLRARGPRQRAEAERRRPLLLAELVLAGAVLEAKLPAGLTPDQWTRLVKKGGVAQA